MMKLVPEHNDLLNDSGLDEMQKTYAYKLAFGCFKALYWTMFILSFAMLMIAIPIENSVIFAICAIIIELITNIIYIIFGIRASKIGAISPAFSEYMAKPSTIISYIALFVVYTTWFVLGFSRNESIFHIFSGIYIAIMALSFITLGFISRRNNKLSMETEDE